MGWRFEKRDGEYRIWSTVVDDYLTHWLDRKEVLNFIYQDRLTNFKKSIIESHMTFPDKHGTMEGSKITHVDHERRATYSDWLQHLCDLHGESYDREINCKFKEAMEFMGYECD